MSLEDTLARAIGEAFWETAERPKSWGAMTWQERQVFQNCARRAVEAGKVFRATRTPQAGKEIPGTQQKQDVQFLPGTSTLTSGGPR